MDIERINRFNRARIDDRQIDELIGISQGLIADGVITQEEAEFLQKWLVRNTAAHTNPVIGGLLHRINDILSDQHLDPEEARELLETLSGIVGGDHELGELQKSSNLPLDNPAPPLIFEDRRYCFTGTFLFGSRKQCEAAVWERGGDAGSLTMSTDYLVIGSYATDSWAHSSFGRKIEKAVGFRQKGHPICIVSESHWIEHL
jgi:NAD-dependent DNA ligase